MFLPKIIMIVTISSVYKKCLVSGTGAPRRAAPSKQMRGNTTQRTGNGEEDIEVFDNVYKPLQANPLIDPSRFTASRKHNLAVYMRNSKQDMVACETLWSKVLFPL